jgi:hypothetical protein
MKSLIYLSRSNLYIYIVTFVHWNIVYSTQNHVYKYVLRKINKLQKQVP